MVIISKKAIAEFIVKEPQSAEALMNWYRETKTSDWKNFGDVKKSFNTVDSAGNGLYVFDIRGNHYRLIARIIFKVRTVFIKFLGTHKDYDKVNLKNL